MDESSVERAKFLGEFGLNAYLPRYRRMLKEWHASDAKYELTAADLSRIVRAFKH